MTPNFEQEAETIAKDGLAHIRLGKEHKDCGRVELIQGIAQALRAAYQKGVLEQFDESESLTVTPKHPTPREQGFEACREAAAKVAQIHAKQQEAAKNINKEAMALIIEEDIRALTPEGKR